MFINVHMFRIVGVCSTGNAFPDFFPEIIAPHTLLLVSDMMNAEDQQLTSSLDEVIPNMNEVDTTRIVWQYDGAGLNNFCSLNSCKKPIEHHDGIWIREEKTNLIAFFHKDCFKRLKK